MVIIELAGKPSRVFVGDPLRQGPLALVASKFLAKVFCQIGSKAVRPGLLLQVASWKDVLHRWRSDSLGSVWQPMWSSQQWHSWIKTPESLLPSRHA